MCNKVTLLELNFRQTYLKNQGTQGEKCRVIRQLRYLLKILSYDYPTD